MIALHTLVLFGVVASAPSVNLNDQNAVRQAAKNMAAVMQGYQKKGLNPINDNGPKGFQWFERGLFHGIMMEYAKVTGDNDVVTATVNDLTSDGNGEVGSFLGNNPDAAALGGKWNDDILWFSFASLTGAEIFGPNTQMPGGVTYLQLTDKTYKEVIADTSDSCGGGLYWIRSQKRTGKNENGQAFSYKSSITNAQAIAHGARLGKLTGNQQYFKEADKLYKWMLSSGTVSSDGTVFDGITPDENCKISPGQFSYKNGVLAGALARLTAVTKRPEYLKTAHTIFAKGISLYVKDNIIRDPCEPQCSQNAAQYAGTYTRGMGELHEYTDSSQIRSQIKQVLGASLAAMLKTCDDKWNCGSESWSLQRPPKDGPNVHFQMNAMELITAYLKTFTQGPVNAKGLAAPLTSAKSVKPPKFDPNSASRGSIGAALGFSAIMIFFF